MNETPKTFSITADYALAAYFGLLNEDPDLAQRFLEELFRFLPEGIAQLFQKCQRVIEAPHLYPFPYDPLALLVLILHLYSLRKSQTKKFAFYNATQAYLAGYLQIQLSKRDKIDTVCWQETIPPRQEKIGLLPSQISTSDSAALQHNVVAHTQRSPLVRFADDATQLIIDRLATRVKNTSHVSSNAVSLSLWSFDKQTECLKERDLGKLNLKMKWEKQHTKVTISLPPNLRLDILAASFQQSYLGLKIQGQQEYWIPMSGMLEGCPQRSVWFSQRVNCVSSFAPVTVNLPVEMFTICLRRFWWFPATNTEARLCIAEQDMLLPTQA